MKNKIYSINKNKYFYVSYIMFSFAIGFVTKISLDKFLDSKYFYDTIKIMSLITKNTVIDDKGFDFSKKFFSILNLPLEYWNITIFLITFLIFLVSLLKLPPNFNNRVFYVILPMWIFIFNIYNNTVSKETIQFFVTWVIAFILCIEKRLLFINFYLGTILVYFSINFRVYLVLHLIVFYALQFIFLKKSNIKSKLLIIFIMVVIASVFLEIRKPDLISSVLNARIGVNQYRANDPDANTIINDIFNNKNNSIIIYSMNSFINVFRFLIPLELLRMHSIKYLVFILYQLIITFLVIRNVIEYKNLDKRTNLILFMTIAIFLVQVIFEPDFGSYLKHQTAYIPFLYLSIFRKGYVANKI
ncbi:hypothetical protein N4T77_05100 [Clostridium sp. CX1]|uniref:hypothetical protein n=1 Tax=Clostridium sp. CX1 TaxID=2978346 RepID=UPI0021C1DD57|nr:hypothetical protein [Clostridium sp. CX1]MCT8975968.1 hypothetical protein [Clostridium sp. CX1]